MKKTIFLFGLLLFLAVSAIAQENTPVVPLKIEAKKKPTPPETKKTPVVKPEPKTKEPDYRTLDSINRRKITMLPSNRLVKPGRDVKLNPRLVFKEKQGSKSHFPDQYLGDVKSNGKFVGVVCRDHEYVDGDRVKIYVNGEVAEYNMLLSGSFKGVNVNLKKGFNRIDFEALNHGTSAPNTAQVNVYDDKGVLISSKKWLLSAGSKATIVVTKE